jgi:hypothetical protein
VIPIHTYKLENIIFQVKKEVTQFLGEFFILGVYIDPAARDLTTN